jgi:FlaG/FlaF family flagellin (archaellin)
VSFTIRVTEAPAAPVVISPGDQSYLQGAEVSLQIEASDPNSGDVLNYSQQGLPETLDLDASSGLVSGTVTATAGDYYVTVKVTDQGGLNDEESFLITINQLNPIVYNATVQDASCNGNDGAVSLQFDKDIDINDLDIEWSTGANTPAIINLQPGSYSVTISGVGFISVVESFVVNNGQQPEKPQIVQQQDRLSTELATGYQWFLNDIPIDGANSHEIVVDKTGSYSVAISDENGCSASSDPIFVEVKTVKEGIAVYPNPVSSGELNIVSGYQSDEVTHYNLRDQLGRLIFSGIHQFSSEDSRLVIRLDTYEIRSGIYLLTLYSNQQGSSIYRISVLY